MEKQIQRAKDLVATPSKSKKTKFAKSKGEQYELNQKLIDKTTKLLGIKGVRSKNFLNLFDNRNTNANAE